MSSDCRYLAGKNCATGAVEFIVRIAWIFLIAAITSVPGAADQLVAADARIRVVSWNISDDAFVSEPQAFQSLLRWADPDVLLLDEVHPSTDPGQLVKLLVALRPGETATWHVDVGESGGRQRGVIASRAPLDPLPEFSSIVPYPAPDKRRILGAMSPSDRANPDWSMEGGIPVHGAVINAGTRRLLAVVTDLQCCGDGPESWQEFRRRVEAREIRRLIRLALEKNRVDGVVLAGDFNMVNSTFPMALLTGPYPMPHAALIPAELYHADGVTTWTWDGRRTPFPSNTLDYQLYGPQGLSRQSGFILDSEGISPDMREQLGLKTESMSRTGRHRPLVVEYEWN
ncbi:MAG: endonuclease/exonuclease/phosphatase family protein [Gammaproteobacteria bacterium]|nr:endonuclease/exonuclease/phosphatase family protein [Gammaproteobacteria bacterium]